MAYANVSTARDTKRSDGQLLSLKMAAVKIFKGSLVAIDANGFATHTPVASKPFAGVAHETIDNSAGSAGDKEIRVEITGAHSFVTSSAAQSWVGKEVWLDNAAYPVNVVASDPGVGPKVGRVAEVVSSTEVRVLITGYAFNVDAEAS